MRGPGFGRGGEQESRAADGEDRQKALDPDSLRDLKPDENEARVGQRRSRLGRSRTPEALTAPPAVGDSGVDDKQNGGRPQEYGGGREASPGKAGRVPGGKETRAAQKNP